MKLRVELVRWGDAHSESDFNKADDPKLGFPMDVVSIGLLMKETEQAVVLAIGHWADGTFGDNLTIPKGMIRERKRLALIDPPTKT